MIGLNELEYSMQQLPLGKTPGLYGFPVEFYRTFWPIIKLDFLKLTEEVHRLNLLSDSQRSGAISLVFKKEDRINLKYYRPISLLIVDVESITEMLAIRLFKVLPTIINSDETCVPGRNIALNTHTLYDVSKYAKSKNIQAAILFIDQEKAIERVDHSFLIKTLEHLNFDNSFVTWLKILMKNITSQVKINGFLTEPSSMTRGKKNEVIL